MSGIWIKTSNGWREFKKDCVNSNDLQGVFRPSNPDILRVIMSSRADRFCAALHEFHPVNNAHAFNGNHFNEPLLGAFGEKL